jgi:hypothetical protein
MHELLPKLAETVDVLLAHAKLRSFTHVSRLEDRFYCLHNAVRSARSSDDVPSHAASIRSSTAA